MRVFTNSMIRGTAVFLDADLDTHSLDGAGERFLCWFGIIYRLPKHFDKKGRFQFRFQKCLTRPSLVQALASFVRSPLNGAERTGFCNSISAVPPSATDLEHRAS
jgi:hypothetical protein